MAGDATRSKRSSTASRCAPTRRSDWPNRSRRRSAWRRARRASPSTTSPTREPLVFSNRFACTVCGYSLTELEPRLFSFNNPNGACGTCGGLGVQEFFDPARVVVNPSLSLAGGAVRGWDRRNAYYFQLIQSLARHFRFDIEAPWNDLPEAVRHALLWGSGEEKIQFRYVDAKGAGTKRSHAWEGILPNLERRYRETESTTVREELAKYRGVRACADCGGSRLNQAARHVFVAGRALPQIAAMSIAEARRFFGEHAHRRLARRNRLAPRPRDRGPPHVPERRRPRLPVARPQRGDALGRRSAAHPARQPDRLGPGRRDVHPRRTVDRPAPARQPAPARHAGAPARPRQHRDRRRARRGRDPAGGLRRRPRARRGFARRASSSRRARRRPSPTIPIR